MNYELIIGNKNLSSWSLRPWLLMKAFNLPFTERLILLRRPETKSEILKHSPSGKVPSLSADGLAVWDSLAITEFLADRHPDLAIWPKASDARAIARCVSAEMHSGFYALRDQFPMAFVDTLPFPDASEKAVSDITRIVEIWIDCRRRFGGSGGFLFGDFCAADAMFAPVASRFVTYQVDLARFGDDGTAARYRDHVLAMPELEPWRDAARQEA